MIEALRLFQKEVDCTKTSLSFKELNLLAIKKGYLVTEKACTKDTLSYISTIAVNPNSTFYKSWNDVISKSRYELLEDQIKHYLSTYGTNYTETPYIPNDNSAIIPQIEDYTVISTITSKEAISRILSLLSSGIALSTQVVQDSSALLAKLNYVLTSQELQQIKNKEFKTNYYAYNKIVPDSPIEVVRVLLYLAINKTLLIKNKETIQAIKEGNKINLSKFITHTNIHKIASVFYRYKPIFLAFKYSSTNNSIVNKLRKLAPIENKPLSKQFWTNALSTNPLPQEQLKHLKELTNFQIISLIEEIRVRKLTTIRPYLVRNGKLFIRDNYIAQTEMSEYTLYNELVSRLSAKACRVVLPTFINLTAPKSEKSFIGNFPLFSSIKMDKNFIVGIYWKDIWGTDDFDISFQSISNELVRWNADYRSNGIVYSGDMTSANPEATELLYFPQEYNKAGIIKCNRYNGERNSSYNLFVAKEAITDMHLNYMVNPNNILARIALTSDSIENTIGLIANKQFYFANIQTGKSAVSKSSLEYIKYFKETISAHIDLKTLLSDAGFTIVDSECDIDLSSPNKVDIINLLA